MASQAAFDLLLLCHFVYLSLTRLVKHSYSMLRANSFSLDGFSPSANISFRSFYLWEPLERIGSTRPLATLFRVSCPLSLSLRSTPVVPAHECGVIGFNLN